MKFKLYTLLALGSLFICSCNHTEDSQGNYPSDGLVRISPSVSAPDLSALHSTRGDAAPAPYTGADLSLSIDYGPSNPTHSSNVQWTKSGESWSSGSTKMYWQDATTPAKVYAYAPYQSTVTDLTKIPFKVQTDQNQPDGLSKSDLVGFVNPSFTPGKGLTASTALGVNFSHKLSKLSFKFTFANEFKLEEQKISSVTLNNTKLDVEYNATTGVATTVPTGSSAPIAVRTATVEGTPCYDVILAPQALLVGADMLTVTLEGNKVCRYQVSENHSFASGKAYIMNLTVGQEQITLGGITVGNWGAETINDAIVERLDIEYVDILATNPTFKMGNDAGRENEKPAHDVNITKGFKMSKYEITNAQYCFFLNANGIGSNGEWTCAKDPDDRQKVLIVDSSKYPNTNWGVTWDGSKWVPAKDAVKNIDYSNFPVIFVKWFGAKAFCNWVGGNLPTEAQWEYACRAGTTKLWSCGDDSEVLKGYAWFYVNSEGKTHEVGKRTANDWALCDMHGNVSEWCSDWYDEFFYYTDDATKDDPTGFNGGNEGSNRVLRGGSWNGDADNCHSAYRGSNHPDGDGGSVGFRVVAVRP